MSSRNGDDGDRQWAPAWVGWVLDVLAAPLWVWNKIKGAFKL